MTNSKANNFIRKRRNSNARKLFVKITGYFIFCYEKLLNDKVTYSKKYCEKSTSYTLEDFLKIRFVTDYLQNQTNKIQCAFPNEISVLEFNYETEKEYTLDNKLKSDKVDILVSNLGLKSQWTSINKEDLYFAFECKRLLSKTKSAEYLTDTKKFVTRTYTKHRFPFQGMIGFIEKSSISITQIIQDLDVKLKKHSSIISIQENGNVLSPFKIGDFEYCRLAKHEHNTQKIIIEVYHSFFDYSEIITD